MPTGFEALHEAVQYHVVNSLRWPALRPLQEFAIGPILAGDDALLLAPTAGGKTEAAMLPLLSLMASDGRRGLSVLYVCPLRALLNNLEPRLMAMAGWLGRRAAVWHGDIAPSIKAHLASDPPDILLTTPESLEAMLMSGRLDHRWLFADLRTVVVDEVHAFARDDRGWHLLGVLARLQRLAGRDLQRIGLSATVGNPAELLDWLADGSSRPRSVVEPATGVAAEADLGIDHVGTLENAAAVIARLHQGQKRLVFCDSRAQVEQLAVALREQGTPTFVSHSSLSLDERRQAETAFASATNCVIVSTSTLELGIDVGDLDRVIQIDAPMRVASFLQRLGRTGRRPGTTRNMLFLATSSGALWQACALTLLWQRGYVEPIVPPASPRHIVAQQILGLVLQEGRVVHHYVWDWLGALGRVEDAELVLAHLAAEGFVMDDGGLVSVGPMAEQEFGRRFFLDLTSSFTSEAMLRVVHGRKVLGSLPPIALAARSDSGCPVVLLGGRAWDVVHIDWKRREARVEISEQRGRSRWNSGGRPMSYALARAHHDVLAGADPAVALSRRAAAALEELRAKHDFVTSEPGERTYLVADGNGRDVWWTFAGFAANSALATGLTDFIDPDSTVGDLRVRLRSGTDAADLRGELTARRDELAALRPLVDDAAVAGLKFAAALPLDLARNTVAERLADPDGVRGVVRASIRRQVLG